MLTTKNSTLLAWHRDSFRVSVSSSAAYSALVNFPPWSGPSCHGSRARRFELIFRDQFHELIYRKRNCAPFQVKLHLQTPENICDRNRRPPYLVISPAWQQCLRAASPLVQSLACTAVTELYLAPAADMGASDLPCVISWQHLPGIMQQGDPLLAQQRQRLTISRTDQT